MVTAGLNPQTVEPTHQLDLEGVTQQIKYFIHLPSSFHWGIDK